MYEKLKHRLPSQNGIWVKFETMRFIKRWSVAESFTIFENLAYSH